MSQVIIRHAHTLVGVCDRQLREMEAQGVFPKRFTIFPNGRATGHLKSEVDAWIEARAATREAA